MKKLKEAGLLIAGSWDEKVPGQQGRTVATQMYGGWY